MDRNKLIKAGKIVKQVREEVVKLIIPGKTYLEVMDFCENRILELGGEIAWAQMSQTVVAAHFCPTDTENPVIEKGDLLKVDLGVHIDGNIADTAITMEVETNKYTNLIETATKALEETIKICKPGVQLRDLGIKQMKIAKDAGLTTIRNLSGHSLGLYKVHAGTTIPTFDNEDDTKLEEGMVIAIEPFITSGEGLIKEEGNSNVFMQVMERNTRSTYGRKIMPYIKDRKGLPFTRKEIERKFGKVVATVGLRDLVKDGILNPYPSLAEISKAPVAQMEHSLIITADGCEVYTR